MFIMMAISWHSWASTHAWEQIYSLVVFISPSGIFSHLRTPTLYSFENHPEKSCFRGCGSISSSLDNFRAQTLSFKYKAIAGFNRCARLALWWRPQDTCYEWQIGHTICWKPDPQGLRTKRSGNVSSRAPEECSLLRRKWRRKKVAGSG